MLLSLLSSLLWPVLLYAVQRVVTLIFFWGISIKTISESLFLRKAAQSKLVCDHSNESYRGWEQSITLIWHFLLFNIQQIELRFF